MRIALLVCAVLLSGCAAQILQKSAESDAIACQNLKGGARYDDCLLARASQRHNIFGGLSAEGGSAPVVVSSPDYTPGSPWPTGPNPGHEADGLHSYWSPQTGPVTCNTFGTFTSCN